MATWVAQVLRRCVPAIAAVGLFAQPAAAGHLQCVPYARQVSGIDIHGNARLWWSKAEGRYDRGAQPRAGAVLAFRPTDAMPLGHVAVVKRVVDDRRILLDHANWSGPGRIEHAALAEDVSEDGDWSAVRVWWGPSGQLGTRVNPTFGFIYGDDAGPNTNADGGVEDHTGTLAARETLAQQESGSNG
ncbi:CHAP domain-containing protein [Altererythrobacter sp. B11]|uniref:CHAP domain-containing protein n=1 Tax=Altererythrobacter sp. B11 TaxID=2060312 RepID=UPI000DC725F2|nr:CHAP domain-containing protein [Altererythrobacter sp. B11]BBC74303.1 CHAP domain-containing protein [Altererythrobacter sp. B11]